MKIKFNWDIIGVKWLKNEYDKECVFLEIIQFFLL